MSALKNTILIIEKKKCDIIPLFCRCIRPQSLDVALTIICDLLKYCEELDFKKALLCLLQSYLELTPHRVDQSNFLKVHSVFVHFGQDVDDDTDQIRTHILEIIVCCISFG